MEQTLQLCPVGIQTFSEIRTKNYLYVDKTALVYRLTHGAPKYIFLSRPRRFGKSLLVSTLAAYFEGRRELFEGLAIEQLEKEWTPYPVLRFDMSTAKHMEKKDLDLERLRHTMRNFYSPLKACDPYLRFVFLTGITKFSQLSIFSELNNIKNISMDESYAAICGITEGEMLTQMSGYIDDMAQQLAYSREEMIQRLRRKYDGYHFTWPSPDIYNPYSLLNAFTDYKLNDYWFGSGTPTYLIEMMRKYQVQPSRIGGYDVDASEFDQPTHAMESIVPLLFQSGYITIKDYDPVMESYHLDIPNNEVRIGLMRSLIAYCIEPNPTATKSTIRGLVRAILQENMEGALRLLQTFLSTVPYTDNTQYEGHYQQVLYIIFSLIGQYDYLDVEVRTPVGRVDMVLRTAKTLYVVELKLNQSAEAAMNQIDLKQYPERFRLTGLPIVKVGINFDSERHTLRDWTIEAAQ